MAGASLDLPVPLEDVIQTKEVKVVSEVDVSNLKAVLSWVVERLRQVPDAAAVKELQDHVGELQQEQKNLKAETDGIKDLQDKLDCLKDTPERLGATEAKLGHLQDAVEAQKEQLARALGNPEGISSPQVDSGGQAATDQGPHLSESGPPHHAGDNGNGTGGERLFADAMEGNGAAAGDGGGSAPLAAQEGDGTVVQDLADEVAKLKKAMADLQRAMPGSVGPASAPMHAPAEEMRGTGAGTGSSPADHATPDAASAPANTTAAGAGSLGAQDADRHAAHAAAIGKLQAAQEKLGSTLAAVQDQLGDKVPRSELDALLQAGQMVAPQDDAQSLPEDADVPALIAAVNQLSQGLKAAQGTAAMLQDRLGSKADGKALDRTAADVDELKAEVERLLAEAAGKKDTDAKNDTDALAAKLDAMQRDLAKLKAAPLRVASPQHPNNAAPQHQPAVAAQRSKALGSLPAASDAGAAAPSGGAAGPVLDADMAAVELHGIENNAEDAGYPGRASTAGEQEAAASVPDLDSPAPQPHGVPDAHRARQPAVLVSSSDMSAPGETVPDDAGRGTTSPQLDLTAISQRLGRVEAGLQRKASDEAVEKLALQVQLLSAGGGPAGEEGGQGQDMASLLSEMVSGKANRSDLDVVQDRLDALGRACKDAMEGARVARSTAEAAQKAAHLAAAGAAAGGQQGDDGGIKAPAAAVAAGPAVSAGLASPASDAPGGTGDPGGLLNAVAALDKAVHTLQQRVDALSKAHPHPPVSLPSSTAPGPPSGSAGPAAGAEVDASAVLSSEDAESSLKWLGDAPAESAGGAGRGAESAAAAARGAEAAAAGSGGAASATAATDGGSNGGRGGGREAAMLKPRMDLELIPAALNQLALRIAQLENQNRRRELDFGGMAKPFDAEKAVKRLQKDLRDLKQQINDARGGAAAPARWQGFGPSDGSYAMLAAKPVMGYRCMACDRPLDRLEDQSGPYIPHCNMPHPPPFLPPAVRSLTPDGSSDALADLSQHPAGQQRWKQRVSVLVSVLVPQAGPATGSDESTPWSIQSTVGLRIGTKELAGLLPKACPQKTSALTCHQGAGAGTRRRTLHAPPSSRGVPCTEELEVLARVAPQPSSFQSYASESRVAATARRP